MAFQFPQAAPYLAATTHAVLFSSPAVPSCSFINFQRKTGMGDCSNSQEQQQNIFPVSTTTGISKRQISLTASSHALHLPVSCQCVPHRPCDMYPWQQKSSYLPDKNDWQPCIHRGWCPCCQDSPREMQEFPALAFRLPKIPQLPTKEDQGCYPCCPSWLNPNLVPGTPVPRERPSFPCSWVAAQRQQLPVIIHDQAQPVARAWQRGLLRLHYPSLQPELEGQTIDTQPQRCTLTPMPQTTRLLNKGQDPPWSWESPACA